MELLGKKVENGWVNTQWDLKCSVGWQQICNAVSLLYNQFHQPELLTSVMLGQGEKIVTVSSAGEILEIEESSTLTIRGFSMKMNCPLMLNFINQMSVVYVIFPEVENLEDFMNSLTKYMNDVELLMDNESSFSKSVFELNKIFNEVSDRSFNIGLSDNASQEEIDAERRKLYEQDGILSFPLRKDYLHKAKELKKDYKRCKIIDSDAITGHIIGLIILTAIITFEIIKLVSMI